jgi:hypothetical protein
MKSRSGKLQPQNGQFVIRIQLKIDEIEVWPAEDPERSFCSKNLIENQLNLGLASWSPRTVIL